MNRSDYAYSVAYIRAIENKLLSHSDIESLITADTLEAAARFLSDKGYGSISSLDNIDAVLQEAFSKCFDEVKSIAPKDAPLDVLLYKNDFHNLKVVLKAVQLGIKDYSNYIILPSTINYETIIASVVKGDISSLDDMLSDVAKRAYDILSTTGDSQLCDCLIDKAAMDYSLSVAKESKNEFLEGLVRLSNTLTDIKIAARCVLTGKDADFADISLSEDSMIERGELIRHISSGFSNLLEYIASCGFEKAAAALKISLNEFEKYSDEAIGEYVKDTKYITLGIEPLISYIYSKQNEIQSIRIIINAKLNDIDEEKIRERILTY